ncbi:MAG: type ISP restriction/modification enzyme, partial [Spirochaetota bacterium]
MNYQNEIHSYYRRREDLYSAGARTEGQLRRAFETLLEQTADRHSMLVIAELTEAVESGRNIRYDGKVQKKGSIFAHGYWEAKDRQDSLLAEVVKKRKAGYSFSNIIFEDTSSFRLYQNDEEVYSGELLSEEALNKGLELFYNYTNQYEEEYQRAMAAFKQALPSLAADLRVELRKHEEKDESFKESIASLHKVFQEFNSAVSRLDIEEFIIQHVLTIDLFRSIYDNNDFEKRNPIAKLLDEQITDTLYDCKKKVEAKTHPLITIIKSTLKDGYTTPQDRRAVLIAVYEDFFKAYNPKKADTHGIVYTPREIVDFMIASCDHLLSEHFGLRLYDKGVRVLDPCTGTGTFVSELIHYIPSQYVEAKQADIYAVEVDVMAYYMAQLNIDEAIRSKLGHDYIKKSYPNLALADTLEISTLHTERKGELGLATYAGITKHNARLVARLEASDFLVILGNPPYNANQQSESENNRNKRYSYIDKRCTETYKAQSSAQKMKLTDMYIRFLRWASDKLLEKHAGGESEEAAAALEGYERSGKGAMLSFISNRSYIDKLFTDGIRKTWAAEWDCIYVVDLGGDLRNSPQNAAGDLKGNVFNIQTGVAICFLIKDIKPEEPQGQNTTDTQARVYYYALEDYQSGKAKKDALKDFDNIVRIRDKGLLKEIFPNEGNWLAQGERDFAGYMSIGNKEYKRDKKGAEPAIFKLYSLGVVTSRDEWVYSHSKEELEKKMQFFIRHYEEKRKEFALLTDKEKASYKGKANYSKLKEFTGDTIKWSDELATGNLMRGDIIQYSKSKIISSLYRPFVKKWLYYDSNSSITHRKYQTHAIFGATGTLPNVCIGLIVPAGRTEFSCYASKYICDLNFNTEPYQWFPRYRYAPHTREDIEAGEGHPRYPKRIDNISDEALARFCKELTRLCRGTLEILPNELLFKDDVFAYI